MAEAYHLQSLRVVFVSKLRPNLTDTISNLQKSLPYVQFPYDKDGFLHVYPQRLQRRAWRMGYLASPFKYKQAQKHYVFHDWRYQFTFRNLPIHGPTTQQVISACLGSMEEDVNCIAEFNWSNSTEKGDLLEIYKRKIDEQKKLEKHQAAGWYSESMLWNQ